VMSCHSPNNRLQRTVMDKMPRHRRRRAAAGLGRWAHMLRTTLLLAAGLAVAPVVAEESVVLGRGISNTYAGDIACAEQTLCLDARYVWELEAKRTVSGPLVKGRVKAVFAQHTDANVKFVRSVELFVLSRIEDPATRKQLGADYSGIALSPQYSGSKYCLPVTPASVGLAIPENAISVDDSGYYCFAKSLVR
jgi:hypothetical protein